MKTVYLLRHAKGESRSVKKPDIQRVLAQRGECEAESLGRRLAELELKPSVIITSPAVRAKMTAALIARQVGYRAKSIRERQALYHEAEDSYLDILHGLEANYGSVMLVGHNPPLSAFAHLLCPDFSHELATCGLVALEFDCDTWKGLVPGHGKLKLYECPKVTEDKPPEVIDRKIIEKDLENQIVQKLVELLEGHDAKALKKVRRSIGKTGRKIARKFLDKIGENRKK